MALFCVLLLGSPLRVRFEDNPDLTACGFYNNVYVSASTQEAAILEAKERVLTVLSANPVIAQDSLSDLVLSVAKIMPTWAFWRQWRRQGFIYYPV